MDKNLVLNYMAEALFIGDKGKQLLTYIARKGLVLEFSLNVEIRLPDDSKFCNCELYATSQNGTIQSYEAKCQINNQDLALPIPINDRTLKGIESKGGNINCDDFSRKIGKIRNYLSDPPEYTIFSITFLNQTIKPYQEGILYYGQDPYYDRCLTAIASNAEEIIDKKIYPEALQEYIDTAFRVYQEYCRDQDIQDIASELSGIETEQKIRVDEEQGHGTPSDRYRDQRTMKRGPNAPQYPVDRFPEDRSMAQIDQNISRARTRGIFGSQYIPPSN